MNARHAMLLMACVAGLNVTMGLGASMWLGPVEVLVALVAMALALDWAFLSRSDTRRSAVFPLASQEVVWGLWVAWDMEVVLVWDLVTMEAWVDMVEQSLAFLSSQVVTCMAALVDWVVWEHLVALVP